MKQKTFLFFLLLTAGICAASPAAGALNICGALIKEPMFGMPAFWLRGDNSTSEVKINASLRGSSLSLDNSTFVEIKLQKSNCPFPVEFELEVRGITRAGEYYVLRLTVPKTIPVDLFDLKVIIETDNNTFSDTQPNAVKIIDEIKNRFSVIHLTDIHVDDIRGVLANPGEALGYKVIKKAIHTINLINPEFVILTGDYIFGLSNFWEYIHLYQVLQDFDVPIFMSIGNHDAINHVYWLGGEQLDGMDAFQALFAPLNFTFEYGDLFYASLNSMDWSKYERLGIAILNFNWMGQIKQEQLDWFEEHLAETDADLIITGYHHPTEYFLGEGKEEVRKIARQYGVDLVLNGHTHYDRAVQDEDVLYLTTGSLMFDFMSDIYPVYRLLEIEENEIVSYAFDGSEASVPVYKDSFTADFQRQLNTPALFCTYSPSNKGLSKTVTATITNHLLQSYRDISLEFVMPVPEPGKTYEVIGGKVVETYAAENYQIWYVTTDINAALETIVTIHEKTE